jgi:hypothetical protein
MSSVEKLIGDLLLRQNCVIIPSFGGFVAKFSSATIDYKNGVMLPPTKSILFNRQLINNDGLLIAELARINQVTFDDSSEIIKSEVEQWMDILKNGERVQIDRVGYLFYDLEKNICFEQDRYFNLLLESYGLGKVHFIVEEDVQLAQKIVAAKPASELEETPIFNINAEGITIEEPQNEVKTELVIADDTKKGSFSFWKYAAAAVLLPIGFYTYWIPMKTTVLESGVISVKDFNPFYQSKEGLYQQGDSTYLAYEFSADPSLEETLKDVHSDATSFSYSFDDDLFVKVKISEAAPAVLETEIVEELPQVTEVKTNNGGLNLDYVVGSFGNQENADNLVALLKQNGLKAYIIGKHKGLIRVSAGHATTQVEIDEIASKTQKAGVEGWVFKR